MQAVEVLQDLGNVISQQLELGNQSVAIFEQVADNLGKVLYSTFCRYLLFLFHFPFFFLWCFTFTSAFTSSPLFVMFLVLVVVLLNEHHKYL